MARTHDAPAHEGSLFPEDARADRHFRLLAESIPQLVFAANPDGSCYYTNARWRDYTGLTPQQSHRDGWLAALHPDDQEPVRLRWRQSVRVGHAFEAAFRVRRADGPYRWFLSRAVPITDDAGAVLRWFGTFTDINDQKGAGEPATSRKPLSPHAGQAAAVTARLTSVPFALEVGVFALIYALGMWLGHRLALEPGHLVLFWLPSGLSFATLLRHPYRRWPAFLLAGAAVVVALNLLLRERPLAVGLGFAAATLSEAAAGAFFLRAFFGRRLSPGRSLHLFGMALAALLVAAPLGALVGAATSWLLLDGPFDRNLLLWWLGDALGILMLSPLLLVTSRPSAPGQVRAWPPLRRGELLLLLGLLAVTTQAVYATPPGYPLPPTMLFPFLIWAALRFGPGGVSMSLLVLAVIAAWNTLAGLGPCAHPATPEGRAVMLQSVLIVYGLTGLILASVGSERRQAEAELGATIEGLERQVAARTRTLADANAAALLSEERFRLAADAAEALVYDVDLRAGAPPAVVHGLERLLGVSPGAEPLTSDWWHARVHPDDLAGYRAAVGRHLKGGANYRLTYRIRHANGYWLRVEDTGQVIRDGSGAAVRLVGAIVDVTARWEAERLLQRYRLLSENARDIVLFVRPDGQIVEANTAAEAAYGYSHDELLRLRIEDLRAPETVPEVPGQMERAEGEGVTFETVHLRKDGTMFPVEVSSCGAEVAGERLLLSIIRDASARKSAEAEIRASEDRFRKAFLANPSAMTLHSLPDGRYLDVNPALTRAAGWTREELLGKTPMDLGAFVDPDDAFRLTQRLLNDGAIFDEELRLYRKDGGINTVLWSAVTIELAGRPAVLTVSVDITERKLAEAALKESEERFRFLAETVPSIVWTAAPDGAILYSNRRWHDYTGLTEEQNRRDWPQLVLHPDDRERCERKWAEHLRVGTDYEIEVRNRCADGNYRWFLTRAVPRKDEQGDVLGWFGVTTDIHEQKQLEERLREQDRRKNEFLATLAHELRNPLAPVRNAVSILQHPGLDQGRLSWCRDVIDRQTEQLARLVDDLLDVSRITQGKITLRLGPTDLAEVVRQAAETSLPLLEARRHELTVSLPSEPVRVSCDLTRLAQVVSNLLNNAAKYTEPGGRVWLTVERDGAEAVLRVRDNGRGIDPALQPNLFELFYQVERNLDRSEGGLGVGLALVKSLVERHGGTVTAHSAGLNQGSEFVIRLPCLADPAPGADAPEAGREDAPAGRGLRVLVVDDNVDTVHSMALLLGMLGHEVLTAHDGRRAVDLALRGRPEVVFLDIGLPYLDGYQACRAIRDGGLAGTLVVAMTGYGQEEDQRRSQEAGFDAHYTKPVKLETIRELLARRAGQAPDG